MTRVLKCGDPGCLAARVVARDRPTVVVWLSATHAASRYQPRGSATRKARGLAVRAVTPTRWTPKPEPGTRWPGPPNPKRQGRIGRSNARSTVCTRALRRGIMPAARTDPRLNTVAWRRLRLLVLARDRHVCQVRGPVCTRVATCVDHIVSRSDGGDMWNPANLRAACRPCNSRDGAARTNARRQNRWVYHVGVTDYESRF
jgi:5-methylcytosine-specific restriction endonuclease McrA